MPTPTFGEYAAVEPVHRIVHVLLQVSVHPPLIWQLIGEHIMHVFDDDDRIEVINYDNASATVKRSGLIMRELTVKFEVMTSYSSLVEDPYPLHTLKEVMAGLWVRRFGVSISDPETEQ
jgi:hypothetical protein